MKSKITLKSPSALLVMSLIASSSIIVLFLSFNSPVQGSYLAENKLAASLGSIVSPTGAPTRLEIPTLYVDSVIKHMGLTPQGAMESPKGPEDAGWFELGVRPGEIGSAVIAGHYGWKEGKPAIFDNLHKLRKGDKIYAEDDKGVITTFVVRESKVYGEHDDAGQVFGSTDGKAHLNLITCGGVYDKKAKSYSNRLVVFADKE